MMQNDPPKAPDQPRITAQDAAELIGIASMMAGLWGYWGWRMPAIVGGAIVFSFSIAARISRRIKT